MASASWSSSRARLRSTGRVGIPRSLPLIECPFHPDETVVDLITDTPRNRGKKFYRCMKNAKTPQGCKFFKWEKDYYNYLMDIGFLEELEAASTDDVRACIGELSEAACIGELSEAVRELKCEVQVLKQEVSKKAQFNMSIQGCL